MPRETDDSSSNPQTHVKTRQGSVSIYNSACFYRKWEAETGHSPAAHGPVNLAYTGTRRLSQAN